MENIHTDIHRETVEREIIVDALENEKQEIVEFKEAKLDFNFDKLGSYFSALANEANLQGVSCAWLVFGISTRRLMKGRTIVVNLKQVKSTLANLGVETEKVDAAIFSLEEALNVLDDIPVHGRDTIDHMLGCMMGIEQILGIEEQNKQSPPVPRQINR